MTSTPEGDRAMQDVRDALTLLRRRFADKFPGRVATLESLFARARDGDDEALADAIQAAHKLRGTAGTFGQPAIGELAGQAEDALLRCRDADDDADDDAGRWDAASAAIVRLRERGLALAPTESNK